MGGLAMAAHVLAQCLVVKTLILEPPKAAAPSPQLATCLARTQDVWDTLRKKRRRRKSADDGIAAAASSSAEGPVPCCKNTTSGPVTKPSKGCSRKRRSAGNIAPRRPKTLELLLRELQHQDATPEDYDLLLLLDESVKKKTLTPDQLDALPEVQLEQIIEEMHDSEAELLCLVCQDNLIPEIAAVGEAKAKGHSGKGQGKG